MNYLKSNPKLLITRSTIRRIFVASVSWPASGHSKNYLLMRSTKLILFSVNFSLMIFFLASLALPMDLRTSNAASYTVVSLASYPITLMSPMTAGSFNANSVRASSSFSVRAAKQETMFSIKASLSNCTFARLSISASSSSSCWRNLLLIKSVSFS